MRLLRVVLFALVGTATLALPPVPAGAGPSVDVRAFGAAPTLGAPDALLNGRTVDLVAHPGGNGYWILGRDGGVFTYGAAAFHGSTGGLALNAPVTGMAAHPSGAGYWIVADDGGVFAFGSARFHGSTGGLHLNAPIVGVAATPSGNGYWLAARDGGIFAFGDAAFLGAAASPYLATAIIGIAATTTSPGYVLAGADGALFSFGAVPAFGGVSMPAGAVDVALTGSGAGAWVAGRDGGVHTYGDAPFQGAALGTGRNAVAIAASAGNGYWIALIPRSADGPAVPAGSGSGRRVVYANSAQRIWLVEADGTVAHTFPVSGRAGVPAPGSYRVFSKSAMSSAHGGELRLPYMTRFTRSRSGLAIGFHGIPLRRDGSPIQSDAELGQYRSAGCVRMNQQQVIVLWNWVPIGTPVVVLR
jgi:lipoprotein-anchoring transpeptidase ErfK/SrfK